jgi:hypothetical protein
MSATMEGNDHNHFDEDISRSIEAALKICTMVIWQINYECGPKGLILAIVVAYVEATLGMLPLSLSKLLSTK